MKYHFLLLLIPLLSGCFKNESPLPQVYAKQQIDISIDSLICASGYEEFDSFLVVCSEPYADITWFQFVGQWEEISFSDTLYLANNPFSAYYIKADIGIETHQVDIVYCANQLYIPETFTPDGDGTNDVWYPVYYNTWNNINSSYTIHWEIRTLDGQIVFHSNEPGHIGNGWDGGFNGYNMPSGTYLYYIEISIDDESPLEYTGAFDLIR